MTVSSFEKTLNFCNGVGLHCSKPPAVCGREEGWVWWVGFILAVYPLQRKVRARCLDMSLCEQDSRNGDEAVGVCVPDVMCTHSWHGVVSLEEESPDDQLPYMLESLLRIKFGHVFSTTCIYCNIELF